MTLPTPPAQTAQVVLECQRTGHDISHPSTFACESCVAAALTQREQATRERCCQVVCLDCQNPESEFQARQDSSGDWYHQAKGWRRLCKADALRHEAGLAGGKGGG